MTGPRSVLVNSSSATHGRYWETEAHHVQALNKTHSDLVKFTSHDADYERVLSVLKSMAAAAVLTTPRGNRPGIGSVTDNPNPRSAGSSPSTLSPLSYSALSLVIPGEESNLQFCM